MSDNVQIPLTGSGDSTANVATDDTGATGQVQIIKLAVSTDGSAALLPANASDGLLVNLGVNNDVTVASLPLPSGAATSAKQDTIIGHVDGIETYLSSLDTKLPSQGQALAAASLPVVLPAAQITTLTPPAAITGFATSAKQDTAQTALDAIKTATETIDNIVSGAGINQTQVGGTNIDTNSGSKSAGTQRVVLATDQPQLTNALKVDGSAVTQPVSGTFWQATQPVSTAAPTTIYNGKKTVTTAGTRVTLAASQAVKSVVIKALVGNTGTIYVGDTSVASTNGFALSPGDTLTLDIANLNTVNLDASVNGEGVTYVGTN